MLNNTDNGRSPPLNTEKSVPYAENGNPGDQKWCPPILMPNPNTGFARVDGPGGPVGDPPTHLDTSSVSEGTL